MIKRPKRNRKDDIVADADSTIQDSHVTDLQQ
jgi:hypothetical protein